jgi:hypothetical protein
MKTKEQLESEINLYQSWIEENIAANQSYATNLRGAKRQLEELNKPKREPNKVYVSSCFSRKLMVQIDPTGTKYRCIFWGKNEGWSNIVPNNFQEYTLYADSIEEAFSKFMGSSDQERELVTWVGIR